MSVRIIQDYSQALELLERTIAKMQGQDVADFGRFIASRLQAESERAFASEVDPSTGQPWAPLATATAADRTRRSLGGSILQRTGSLRREVFAAWGVSKRTSEAKLWGLGILPSSVAKRGTVLYYGRNKRMPMTGRRFMGLSAASIRAIEDYGARVFSS